MISLPLLAKTRIGQWHFHHPGHHIPGESRTIIDNANEIGDDENNYDNDSDEKDNKTSILMTITQIILMTMTMIIIYDDDGYENNDNTVNFDYSDKDYYNDDDDGDHGNGGDDDDDSVDQNGCEL